MTVCRYFERGNCRYGDRCRFEHVKSNNYSYSYNQKNVGNYQERYGRQETGQSNYHRYDDEQRNQRYESRNYYQEEQRNYSPNRYQENYRYQSPTRSGGYDNHYYQEDQRSYSPNIYQENYRYQSPTRSGGYDNQYQNRYKQSYEQQPHYNERNYGRNQQYSENENGHSQNRYQWKSDDYKKQIQKTVEYSETSSVHDSYTTSTPKGKVSFSFKLPESEIKKDSSALIKFDEQDQFYANVVKDDAISWELGGLWPFTCYFPCTDKHGFPGFYDVSPEELRYAAYNAEKNNSYESYVQAVQNALVQVNQQRSDLQVATPQLLSTLRRIRNGEDLYSTSKMINPISSTPSAEAAIESMETAAFTTPVSSAAASFSFKMPSETDSATKPSAFSFKLPASTDIKAASPTGPDGDANIYTPLANLIVDEKEQFSASTFILGKIPTRPPPQAFCT